MTRTSTLQAIDALPVSDAVKAHARRLIEGLPEWAPMPGVVNYACDWLTLEWSRGIAHWLIIMVDDDRGAPVYRYQSTKQSTKPFIGGPITDRDVWELLRQLTGMVAITNRGG